MLPEARRDDLLYVSSSRSDVYGVSAFSYKTGKFVGELSGFSTYVNDLCTDSKGDVFVPSSDGRNGHIYEYSHGATAPFQTLTSPGLPFGCSVDRTTGNLAVVFSPQSFTQWGLAVFTNARGTPSVYYPSNMYYIFSCAYDNAGNVYVDGSAGDSEIMSLAEIPAGGNSFTSISVNEALYYPQALQWDGRYLAMALLRRRAQKHTRIERLQISGSTATLVATVELRSKNNAGQDVILNNTVIEAGAKKAINVGAWPYPRGGEPRRVVAQVDAFILGIAFSAGPK